MPRYALVIGISQYTAPIRNLPKAATDAEAVATFFEQHHYQVTRLPRKLVSENQWVIASDRALTAAELGQELKIFLKQRAKHQEAVIYFAGHGFRWTNPLTDRSVGFLATSDSTKDGGKAIAFDDLNTLISESELSSLLMLMDCCYAGTLLEQDALLESTKTALKRRIQHSCLIAACRDFERAREGEKHGIFTAAVLEGLSDQNAAHGEITSNDLVGFVARTLKTSGQEVICDASGSPIPLITYAGSSQAAVTEKAHPFDHAMELVQAEFEVLEQQFFEKLQQNPGRSHILKLPAASWSLILQGNYIERDQQAEAFRLAKELANFPGTSLLLIRGEPGAGKTALMRWLSYALVLEGGLVLQKKSQETLGWLNQLQEFSEQLGDRPLYVIVDDLFRDDALVAELEQNEALPNLTLIGTTRFNESRHERLETLEYTVRCLDLNRPSEAEKQRVLEKVCQDEEIRLKVEQMTLDERQQLLNSPIMLVLMLQLSEGKTFDRIIADIIKRLPNSEQRPTYQVFGVLCSFFQYGMATPPEIIDLCVPSFRQSRRLVLSDLEGLVDTGTYADCEGLTTIHELIAKTAMQVAEKPQSERENLLYSWIENPPLLERNLRLAIAQANPTQESQKRWVCWNLNRLVNAGYVALVQQILEDYPEHIRLVQEQGSITAWSTWAKLYRKIGPDDECQRCLAAILAALPEAPNEWEDWLSLILRQGNNQQRQYALTHTQTWLGDHPEDHRVRTKYLALIETCGTAEQKQQAITQTQTWLEHHPEDHRVRAKYLILIETHGTAEQKQQAIAQTQTWLESYPENTGIRERYLALIETCGTVAQKRQVVTQTQSWLESYPENAHVRAKYLAVIETYGTAEQKQQAITRTQCWLEADPENAHIRERHLTLIETYGTAAQKQQVMGQMQIWLEAHSENINVRQKYLGLIENYGTAEQKQRAVMQTQTWLEAHSENTSIRQKYLSLIETCGTVAQQQQVIEQTQIWLETHPEDNNVRQKYLALIQTYGTAAQQQQVMTQTRIWLEAHPEDNNVRQKYLGLIESCGTTEQQQQAITQTQSWLEVYSEDTNVRQKYLTLIETYGTAAQQQQAIVQTQAWLETHPEDGHIRQSYLGLIGRTSKNSENIQDVISQQWHWFSRPSKVEKSLWATFLPVLYHHSNVELIQKAVASVLNQYPKDLNLAIVIFGYFRDHLDYEVCCELAELISQSSLPVDYWNRYTDVASFFRDYGELDRAESIYRRTLNAAKYITSKAAKGQYILNYASINYARLLLLKRPPNISQSIRLIQPILAKNFKHAVAHWIMAQCHTAKGKRFYQNAISSFHNAIRFDRKKEGFFWYQFGCFHRDYLDDTNQAKSCFEKSLVQKVTLPACVDLAELELETGNLSKAKVYLQKGLELIPANRIEREERQRLSDRIQVLQDQLHL